MPFFPIRIALALLLGAVAASALAQQAWPGKPVRLIVPWAPGGTSDIPWRIIGPKLSETLGQPILIENRPGAAGTIGSAVVAASKPDGYTLLANSSVHALSAALYKSLPYHAINDFIPIAQVVQSCSVLVVHPSLPIQSAREFVAYAKANPGKIDFSSTGNGSGQHLFMALLSNMNGLSLNHVPYKNVGQALSELMAGQVKASIPGVSIVAQHIRDGKLRPLAVTCARRSRFLPDVPTLDESAAPGFDATLREGLLAPKGVPAEIVQRLESELRRIVELPEVQKGLLGITAEPIFGSGELFGAALRADLAKWQKLVKEIGVQVD